MSIKSRPNQSDRYALADAIRHGREARRLTQEQLAEIVGCTRRWIQTLELGKGNPNWLDTIRIMAALGIDPAEFAQGVGLYVPVHPR